ncbi:MAG TPA: hypothetical protein VN370_09330 [Desulfitobacteriaceae bacterium]|nr:hypothetical protein [Desulfitobacteriaceae bacterium]
MPTGRPHRSREQTRRFDAVATAARFGISANRAANYHADREGTRLNYEALSHAVSELRAGGALADSWKAEIDEDYEKRNK